MNVRELIEKLKLFRPDEEVRVSQEPGGGLGGPILRIDEFKSQTSPEFVILVGDNRGY